MVAVVASDNEVMEGGVMEGLAYGIAACITATASLVAALCVALRLVRDWKPKRLEAFARARKAQAKACRTECRAMAATPLRPTASDPSGTCSSPVFTLPGGPPCLTSAVFTVPGTVAARRP